MVCKKSLYCLKNGPCATYQIRKQIWEDNIRFRESLKNINQSDHYWSFQITNNDFSDLEEPSFHKKKQRGYMKFRNCYDCASVTHEYDPEAIEQCKTCFCSKRNGNPKKLFIPNDNPGAKEDSPETKAMMVRPSKQIQTQVTAPNQRLNSCSNFTKLHKNVSEYCHRYRNSLSSAQLAPSTKVKFPSQSTLVQPKKYFGLKRFPSMEVLSKEKCYPSAIQNDHVEKTKLDKKKELDGIKIKKDFQNKEIKLPPWLSGTPLSRTTRKMLNKDKQIPFTSFGCNNANDIVGSKKTHNVYASTKEIYPNALSAKQQRDDMIMKSLKNEKQFRNSLLQDSTPKKLINHSSLWASEGSYEQKDRLQRKSKKITY